MISPTVKILFNDSKICKVSSSSFIYYKFYIDISKNCFLTRISVIFSFLIYVELHRPYIACFLTSKSSFIPIVIILSNISVLKRVSIYLEFPANIFDTAQHVNLLISILVLSKQ